MTEPVLNVLAVVGTLNRQAATRVVVEEVAARLRATGANVDLVDWAATPLPLFNTDVSYQAPERAALLPRVERADVLLLGTPDYHGCMSGVLKNFLDHFWAEFAGKLFATVVSSYDKGLTVTDEVRTVARQCYAWSMPYGLAFAEKEDVKEGRVAGAALAQRLDMLARDLRVYGALLAAQRRRDLAGEEAGFMARYRGR